MTHPTITTLEGDQAMIDNRDPFSTLVAGVRTYLNTQCDETTRRDALIAANRQYLADLSDTEFAGLVAEVRQPH